MNEIFCIKHASRQNSPRVDLGPFAKLFRYRQKRSLKFKSKTRILMFVKKLRPKLQGPGSLGTVLRRLLVACFHSFETVIAYANAVK